MISLVVFSNFECQIKIFKAFFNLVNWLLHLVTTNHATKVHEKCSASPHIDMFCFPLTLTFG